jgi:hypothetical protein
MPSATMLRNGHNTRPQGHHRTRDQPSQSHGIAPDRRFPLKIQP